MSIHESPKLILYIAISLDGFIAKPDGDTSWLSIVEKDGEDYGYADFLASVETIIVGRKTFDKIMSMGFDYTSNGKTIYVISHNEIANNVNVKFYSGDLKKLVKNLKENNTRNIYCDGGAEIVNSFLLKNLFDELIISIIPILLGEGISLFKNGLPEQYLTLLEVCHYKKGLVQLHYKVNF